mgnify:CR=1 FL=1
MNIEGKGYHQWTLEFQAALKGLIGALPPKIVLKQAADDLKEEWFRGTPPQQAALAYLRTMLGWNRTKRAV